MTKEKPEKFKPTFTHDLEDYCKKHPTAPGCMAVVTRSEDGFLDVDVICTDKRKEGKFRKELRSKTYRERGKV